jgi:hypothetical protein
MKPIKFKQQNCTYAEGQPEYQQLPAHRKADGTVISCWALTWPERWQILFTGVIFWSVLTFNHPLQPQQPGLHPFGRNKWPWLPRWFKNLIGRHRFGGCYRCGDRWNWKARHVTQFTPANGCFALCEECWYELTPAFREPFYAALIDQWRTHGPVENDLVVAILEAVRAGE